MSRILAALAQHAQARPAAPAITDGEVTLEYGALHQVVVELSGRLNAARIAFLLDNGCAWALVDLAVTHAGATGIPVPTFFSDDQLRHLLEEAAPDLVITDRPQRLEGFLDGTVSTLEVAGRELAVFRPTFALTQDLPPACARITYTSGTTGRPRGVCLDQTAIDTVTFGLVEAVQGSAQDCTLALLPLTTLLENIGGLYAPLVCGGRAALPSLADCGMTGSSGVQPGALMAALSRFQPTTCIVVPQLLKVMVEAAAAGAPVPGSLRFLAVGGAPLAPALIERARALGLPAYQGYGLSEAASVVSLNCPGDDRTDSVGRPLPHTRVRISAEGEIEVAGSLFNGYLSDAGDMGGFWPTGDLGYLDDDGYLHVTGRSKTAFATAYGRNVSPEWVESELTAGGAILQAAVFGEGRPFNVAVLVPTPVASAPEITAAISRANARLPDYARLGAWCMANEPFTVRNGMAKAGGALDRPAIAACYGERIEALYNQGDVSNVHV